jgi:hypothetical protein
LDQTELPAQTQAGADHWMGYYSDRECTRRLTSLTLFTKLSREKRLPYDLFTVYIKNEKQFPFYLYEKPAEEWEDRAILRPIPGNTPGPHHVVKLMPGESTEALFRVSHPSDGPRGRIVGGIEINVRTNLGAVPDVDYATARTLDGGKVLLEAELTGTEEEKQAHLKELREVLGQ